MPCPAASTVAEVLRLLTTLLGPARALRALGAPTLRRPPTHLKPSNSKLKEIRVQRNVSQLKPHIQHKSRMPFAHSHRNFSCQTVTLLEANQPPPLRLWVGCLLEPNRYRGGGHFANLRPWEAPVLLSISAFITLIIIEYIIMVIILFRHEHWYSIILLDD